MRKYYIDNIRWMIIFLLIPYHAAMAWNTWGEPNYIYLENNQTISSIVVFLSPYFMPLMFLIAGVSTKFALQKRTTRQYILERAKKLLIPFAIIWLWGLPLPLLGELLSIGGKSLAEYTYLFLVGYYIFTNDDIISKVEKYKWVFLCVGLAATVFNVYLFIWSDTQVGWLNMTAKYIAEQFMINALLGIGKRYWNLSGKISKYLSKRSYSFYIFHFIWVVWLQYLLVPVCRNHIILLFVLPMLLAYGATLMSCEICHRVPLFSFLR